MSAAAKADGVAGDLGRTPRDAMSSLLAESWWLIALRGLLAIVFRIVALIMPVAVLLSLALHDGDDFRVEIDGRQGPGIAAELASWRAGGLVPGPGCWRA